MLVFNHSHNVTYTQCMALQGFQVHPLKRGHGDCRLTVMRLLHYLKNHVRMELQDWIIVIKSQFHSLFPSTASIIRRKESIFPLWPAVFQPFWTMAFLCHSDTEADVPLLLFPAFHCSQYKIFRNPLNFLLSAFSFYSHSGTIIRQGMLQEAAKNDFEFSDTKILILQYWRKTQGEIRCHLLFLGTEDDMGANLLQRIVCNSINI